MSSSDPHSRMAVTAWALDELEMPHAFDAQPGRELAPLSEAELEAEQLASPQERARIEAAAYAHGRADGEKIARAELTPHVEHAASALSAALENVRVHQARWTANAEENLAVLAVAVARQLIAKEVESDAGIVSALVKHAIEQFPLDQTVTVRLHPDDVESCTALLRSGGSDRIQEIRWAPDSHVHRGGCLVEGRERIIDGRVDTALERIYRVIGNVQAS
ncbi:MAG: hypothetical protein H7Z40_16765 [Phycisphaerae bacterium]|nr:hypothetical protein [Gemmatimonadaceae bacterium]